MRALLRQVAQRVFVVGHIQGIRGKRQRGRIRASRRRGFDCRVETRALDLSKLADSSLFAGHALVTASALLDLVSVRLAAKRAGSALPRCRGAMVLFALTYDGRITWEPAEPEEAD